MKIFLELLLTTVTLRARLVQTQRFKRETQAVRTSTDAKLTRANSSVDELFELRKR